MYNTARIKMTKIHHKIKHNLLKNLFKTKAVQYLFVSHNTPHRALVICNKSGNYQVYSSDFERNISKQITNVTRGTLFGSVSPDGEYIYTLKDYGGGEHGHFIRTMFDGKKKTDITPNLPPYFSYSVSSTANNDFIFFTAAIEDKNKVFVTHHKDNSFGLPRELYSSNSFLSEPICSLDGRYVCVAETDNKKNNSRLVLIDNIGGTVSARSKVFNALMPLTFSSNENSPAVFVLARIKDRFRPVLYNFKNNSFLEISHKSFLGDVWVLKINEDNDTMLLCDVYEAKQLLYLYNTRTHQIKRIGPKTGGFNFHFDSAVSLKDSSIILKWHNFNKSPRLIKLHPPKYNKWSEVSQWNGNSSSNYLFEYIWFKSSDGNPVQMWVARPSGVKKPIPFVINIHGGPHGVVGDEYSPEAQAWLKTGFGYCSVNYRGSIGFGKKFEQKIYGNPGYWEVEDVVSARNWLVKKKYADAKNITLYGWSWGGFVTLLALGKYPKLWNCGIAGASIADCIMQYEDEPAYFKAEDIKRFKGTPKTVRAQYQRSSPSTYVNNIKAPILLMHGKNDVRCPPRQIKYFNNLLKKANKKTSLKWFNGGHIGGFTDTELRASLIVESLKFAINNLCSASKMKNLSS